MQPIAQPGEPLPPEGIIRDYSKEEIPQTPASLVAGFEWSTIDLSDPAQRTELCEFLRHNYISNSAGKWRYAYSEDFLEWVLNGPGSDPEFLVGVRISSNRRIVGFMSGFPISVRMNDRTKRIVAADFLCVHERLRGKNLARLLLDEFKRRGILKGFGQLVYTSATLLAQPLTTARFRHRLINYEKLAAVGFTVPPIGARIETLIRKYAVPRMVRVPGFRAMEAKDVAQVTVKLNAALEKFRVAQVFSEEEAAHWFVPRPGVVASYVVERNDGIDGFFSFYIVTADVNGVMQYPTMTIAYVFYYFAKPSLLVDLTRAAIQSVHWDYGADVIHALNIQDNAEFQDTLNFSKGTGELHYYIVNFVIPPIRPNEIALVLT
jgi:glycylpeptide N-tetradecanoyltransferase